MSSGFNNDSSHSGRVAAMMGCTRKMMVACEIAILGVCLPSLGVAANGSTLSALSSRPDTVSGGDVLIKVAKPRTLPWRVMLNGRDISHLFRPVEDSDADAALVPSLAPGRNTLELREHGRRRDKLVVINHSSSGPIFSGPHQSPFICQTVENGLGPPLDADCSAQTDIQYYYKPIGTPQSYLDQRRGIPSGFKEYDPTTSPTDVLSALTSNGRSTRYIVRRETGTLNRAVYRIEFLHDPTRPLPTPWNRGSSDWNGRLVYLSVAEPGSVSHVQGVLRATDAFAEALIAQGYAVARSTFNAYGVTSDYNLSAETMSMVKEHFIKQYGVPEETIAVGESGGTIQQHLIAENFPSLVDGLIDFVGFPDIISTIPQSSTDCALLDHAFKESTYQWTEEQKTAVSGFATWRTCLTSIGLFGRSYVDPGACNSAIPKDLVYDKAANPAGVRCDIYSSAVNILGRSAETGVVRRPLDNVGVQYGLVAFNHGKIDADVFVDLNARMGGYDKEGNMIASRTEGDTTAIRLAYSKGLVLNGRGLADVPIIDSSPYYSDDLADVHDHFRALVTRARLIEANGSAANEVILVNPRPELLPLYAPYNDRLTQLASEAELREVKRRMVLVQSMDRWLHNIKADMTDIPRQKKTARDKPAELADGCLATDGERIAEPATYDGQDRCNQLYPPHGDPRLAAGAPLTEDILKCALKPIELADYSQNLTADQFRRLKQVFPSGVCDYNRPGIGQGRRRGRANGDYSAGPDNRRSGISAR